MFKQPLNTKPRHKVSSLSFQDPMFSDFFTVQMQIGNNKGEARLSKVISFVMPSVTKATNVQSLAVQVMRSTFLQHRQFPYSTTTFSNQIAYFASSLSLTLLQTVQQRFALMANKLLKRKLTDFLRSLFQWVTSKTLFSAKKKILQNYRKHDLLHGMLSHMYAD